MPENWTSGYQKNPVFRRPDIGHLLLKSRCLEYRETPKSECSKSKLRQKLNAVFIEALKSKPVRYMDITSAWILALLKSDGKAVQISE